MTFGFISEASGSCLLRVFLPKHEFAWISATSEGQLSKFWNGVFALFWFQNSFPFDLQSFIKIGVLDNHFLFNLDHVTFFSVRLTHLRISYPSSLIAWPPAASISHFTVRQTFILCTLCTQKLVCKMISEKYLLERVTTALENRQQNKVSIFLVFHV